MNFGKNKPTQAIIYFITFGLAFSNMLAHSIASNLENEITIVGGGIAGALHAYHAHREAVKNNTTLHITICEKNKSIADTTTSNIVPSLTPDEILSVVPRGKALVEKLQSAFYEPGGIRVDDVDGTNNAAATNFLQQAAIYSQDDIGHQERTKTLLELGKMSMDLWQSMYDNADSELKAILIISNFNPCHETHTKESKILHDGYRIDLIYNITNALNHANNMKADYESIGYKNCAILSPTEVMAIDPFLTDFCKSHAEYDASGTLQWHKNSVALWRPGGCINTNIFLPKFFEYLKKAMGTYVDAFGRTHDCFKILYDKEVVGVDFETNNNIKIITGLHFSDGFSKHSDHTCKNSLYIFCPGEALGTLKKLDLQESAYAGFAGASLLLNIPIPEDKIAHYKTLNHCMEVHLEGIVQPFQSRLIDDKISIGVAGTKAFYGDQRPTKDQAFAKNRNLVQLNIVNDVLPEFISLALGRDTKGQKISQADMDFLEQKNIIKRWAGVRAVVYDGFPTLGRAYHADGTAIDNAIITTHLGSGGVSFGPAAVAMSYSIQNKNRINNPLADAVLNFARSNRTAQ